MKIYKICTAEKYSLLVNDITLLSDNPLRFRKILLEWIYSKIMTTDDQIKDEKAQYDINLEAAKISALLYLYIYYYIYIYFFRWMK